MIITAEQVLPALDHLGIGVFALTGALAALRKGLDVVGMAVLAEMTALGGGVLRDLMIGTLPPAASTNIGYVVLPLAATAVVFFWHPHLDRISGSITVLDAAGLGLFCVTGAVKALDHGISPVHATLLGVCTAVGGGVLRDLLSNEIPAVLHDRQFYALPAVLGAGTVSAAHAAGLAGWPVSVAAAALAFGLRMAALHYRWRTPAPPGTP
jgi:uncharacterized membrane protein YeiH